MSTASTIIDLFGGTRPAAAKLGLPVSTVQSWKTKGHIPGRRQQLVLDRARAHGIAVTPASFFEGSGELQAADNSMCEKFVQDGGDHETRPVNSNGAAVAS